MGGGSVLDGAHNRAHCQQRKYLIVKIAAIGDVIMALPIIDEIRRMDSEAVITWICGKAVEPILKQFGLHELIVVDERKLLRGNRWQQILEVWRVWQRIALRQFDVVVTAHAARQYGVLTLLTRAGQRHSLDHRIGSMCPISLNIKLRSALCLYSAM